MRFLRAFFIFLRAPGFVRTPAWLPTDAENLSRFMQTGSGAKLRAIMVAQIAAANEQAAFKHDVFECGRAVGYRGLLAWFETLSAPARADESSESKTDPFGEESGLEHLSP